MSIEPSARVERTRHVLVIDDDPLDRDFVEQALDGFPIACESIDDGEEAVLHLAARCDARDRPDLIFLDLNLPRRNGFEVLASIRSELGLVGVPVVVLSTSAELRDVDRSYRAGANLFLTKSEDVGEFIGSVRAAGAFTLGLSPARSRELATPLR